MVRKNENHCSSRRGYIQLDSISSESYRDGNVRYTVRSNEEFLNKIVPEEEIETETFEFIKGMSFKDGTDYYKISIKDKEFKFSPDEVFFS